jgi:hypothetical protein
MPPPPPLIPSHISFPNATTDCIALVVAFLVYITVVRIIVKLLRRKSDQNGNGGPHNGLGVFIYIFEKSVGKGLLSP